MADRNFVQVQTPGRARVAYSGSFGLNGTGAPVNLRGRGFTVAYTSVGLFTITFNDKFGQLDALIPSIQYKTAAAAVPQVGLITATTAQVRNLDAAGSVQDIAADADNRMNFIAYFRASTIEY